MKADNLTFFRQALYLIIGWILCVVFLWSAVDIVMSAFGMLPANYSMELEYVKGRGMALKHGMSDMAYINKDGLRRSELPPLAAGESRILMLGESTCFSYYVLQGQDWPTRVEQELRSRGVFATTMNGGVPGYDMSDVYFALNWHLQRIPVDMVILYQAWNDFYFNKCIKNDCFQSFDFDESVNKIFPHWPDSFEVNPEFNDILLPLPPPAEVLADLRWFRPLVLNSPLGNYIFKHIIPRISFIFNAQKGTTREGWTLPELYLLYLGSSIDEAQRNGVKPVILRPFSIFRAPDFQFSELPDTVSVQLTNSFEMTEQEMPNMLAMIRVIDLIADKLAEQSEAVVLDPTAGLLAEITPRNAYENSYLKHSPHHTGDKGDLLLADVVADLLVEEKLVTPVENWQPGEVISHPYETKKVTDFKLTRRSLDFKNITGKTIFLSGLLAFVFTLVGYLVIWGVKKENTPDLISEWSMAIGLAATLFLGLFLFQFVDNPGAALLLAWILLLSGASLFLLKNGAFNIDNAKRACKSIFLMSLIGTGLIFAGSNVMVPIVEENYVQQIPYYLTWMDIFRDYDLFMGNKGLANQAFQEARATGDSNMPSYFLLIQLLINSVFFRQGGPFLASGISEGLLWLENLPSYAMSFLGYELHGNVLSGVDCQIVFLTVMGLVGSVAVLPCVSLVFRSKNILYGITAILLGVSVFMLGLNILVPIAQVATIALTCMAFGVIVPVRTYNKGLAILVSSGAVLFLPTPWVIFIVGGVALVFGLCEVRKDGGWKDVVRVLSIAAALTVFSKALLLRYLSGNPALHEWLASENYYYIMLEPFSPKNSLYLLLIITVLCFAVSFNAIIERKKWLFIPGAALPFVIAFFYIPKPYQAVPVFVMAVLAIAMLSRRVVIRETESETRAISS